MIIEELKNIDLFKSCEENLINQVKDNLKILDEKNGITIINQGDDTKSLYIILKGTLLITQFAEDGKVVSFDLIKKGQCFGEIAIIDGEHRSASVSTMEDVKLGILSERFVKDILMNDINFSKALLLKFAGIVRSANIQIFSLITASARKRLLLQLVRLSKMVQGKPHLRVVEKGLSHTAIGSFAGVSRETVTRIIGELKSDNVISLNEMGEIILNIEDISFELSSIIGTEKKI